MEKKCIFSLSYTLSWSCFVRGLGVCVCVVIVFCMKMHSLHHTHHPSIINNLLGAIYAQQSFFCPFEFQEERSAGSSSLQFGASALARVLRCLRSREVALWLFLRCLDLVLIVLRFRWIVGLYCTEKHT